MSRQKMSGYELRLEGTTSFKVKASTRLYALPSVGRVWEGGCIERWMKQTIGIRPNHGVFHGTPTPTLPHRRGEVSLTARNWKDSPRGGGSTAFLSDMKQSHARRWDMAQAQGLKSFDFRQHAILPVPFGVGCRPDREDSEVPDRWETFRASVTSSLLPEVNSCHPVQWSVD
jgi:hypothetical protein